MLYMTSILQHLSLRKLPEFDVYTSLSYLDTCILITIELKYTPAVLDSFFL